MSEELVEIEVDGRTLQARKGAMLIEVTDANGIEIPRFCYHKKLSVAANCRMCLVDVEKAPKPMPACATPVMPGMKVQTRSPRAIAAQKGTMEFLLINHPLDCPICDQGGECELQDVAMGYGQSRSEYVELKRVVPDPDLGPLIATEMTRCIHCTRCVRFGEEVAGVRELGATGRGEFVRIGTYVSRTVDFEMSGNVIDLCPVGALTAKPSRYTARAWEMIQRPSVAAHDSVGSNTFVHSRRGEIVRVVPRENEAVNETWLSDRDRFSYQGLYAADRVARPMLKRNGQWSEVEWDEALQAAATALRRIVDNYGAGKLGALVSPQATLEEQFLAQKIMRALGSHNIDHRLRQLDFSDQNSAPVMPWLGTSLADLEQLDAALLIDSHLRKDQPMANHRLRKAAMRGAAVSYINPARREFNYPLREQLVGAPAAMVLDLAAVLKAALGGNKADPAVADLVAAAEVKPAHQAVAESLAKAGNALVLLGSGAVGNPYLSQLRALAAALAAATGARFGYLAEAANTAGAWLSGCVPHRLPGGVPAEAAGVHVDDMLRHPLKGYLLLGVEPDSDLADPALAHHALRSADTVVALTAYANDAMLEVAEVILPIGAFAETSGTFVNAEGLWQSFQGACAPYGEARPAWKVLRVLANTLELTGFDQLSSEQVRDELKTQCRSLQLDNGHKPQQALAVPKSAAGLHRYGSVAIYACDSVVRRATALQQTRDAAQSAAVLLSPATATGLKLHGDSSVVVRQGDAQSILELRISDAVPDGLAWIAAGVKGAEALGCHWGPVSIEAVPA